MKGPSWVQWGSRGEANESSCVFQRENNIFNANLYRHKIVNIGLGRFSTLGAQTTASEASRPSACAKHSRGPGGWPPGGGCKGAAPTCVRKFCILQAKYAYFQAFCGLNLQKYMIWSYNGAAKFCELNIGLHKFGPFLV